MSSFERAKRVDNTTLLVDSKTIGSDLRFPLRSQNLSRSGMYLTWESSVRIPFIENTIIEMCIDTAGKFMETPVSCLGKVVRRVETTDATTNFGIKIVQIEEEDQGRYDAAIAELDTKGTLKVA